MAVEFLCDIITAVDLLATTNQNALYTDLVVESDYVEGFVPLINDDQLENYGDRFLWHLYHKAGSTGNSVNRYKIFDALKKQLTKREKLKPQTYEIPYTERLDTNYFFEQPHSNSKNHFGQHGVTIVI